MRRPPRTAILLALSLAAARADSVWTEDVSFAITNDVGAGNAVFVAGSAANLGGWNTTRAVRLNWSAGNVWRGTVTLPRGMATRWRPFVRAETATAFTNAAWFLADSEVTPPSPPPAPYAGKSIHYLSGWATSRILWRVPPDGAWTDSTMVRVGDGRAPGEGLFALDGIGQAGRPIEFVPNNGAGQWDNPGGVSGANYWAAPDAVWLQDGGIHDYVPAATPSAPRFVTNNSVTSTQSGIGSRRVRVLLPRGYDENTAKRYPVVYFHDGQNVFDPGGAFGSWSADATVVRETAAGRIRECLVVAVDNSAARMNEYRPPGDLYQGADGIGDRYRDFLVQNVKPWVDANFRTSPDAADHALIGSSLGGLITHYIGQTGGTFRLLGVCSPSYWIAPNFRTSIAAAPKPASRVWMDWGSAEGASMWDHGWPIAATLDGKGMVRGRDLHVLVGAGDAHNEATWARRLPELLRFLLPVTDGPNQLLMQMRGVKATATGLHGDTFRLGVPALRGFRYQLRGGPDLAAPPATTHDLQSIPAPWGELVLEHASAGNADRRFYRVYAW